MDKSDVIIFNSSFFRLSETFIRNQVEAIAENYKVTLLAEKFENFSANDQNRFERVELYKPHKNGIDRVLSKCSRIFNRKKKDEYYRFGSYNQRKIRKVLAPDNIKLVHAHYGPSGLRILPFVVEKQLPLVVSFHGYDLSFELRNPEYVRHLPELIEYATWLVVVSQYMVDILLDFGCPISKIKLLPYGVDTTYFNSLSNETQEQINIVHSGRIVPKKGVPDLISCFAKLCTRYSNVRLHILGDGSEASRCQVLVKSLNIDSKVSFYGAQPKEKVKELLSHADIFVLNSRTDDQGDMEGFPNSILEAMSMGKAVISTYHAGIPAIIDNGQNGVLVHEKDNTELLQAMEMLTANAFLRKQIGANARLKVQNNFELSGMKLELQKLVQNS